MGNCFGSRDDYSHSAGQPAGYGRVVAPPAPAAAPAPPAQNQYFSNDYELVIRISKKLEVLLKTRYGAEGEGLGNTVYIYMVVFVICLEFNFFNSLLVAYKQKELFCLTYWTAHLVFFSYNAYKVRSSGILYIQADGSSF